MPVRGLDLLIFCGRIIGFPIPLRNFDENNLKSQRWSNILNKVCLAHSLFMSIFALASTVLVVDKWRTFPGPKGQLDHFWRIIYTSNRLFLFWYMVVRRKMFQNIVLNTCYDRSTGDDASNLQTNITHEKTLRQKSLINRNRAERPLVVAILVLLGTGLAETLLFDLDLNLTAFPNLKEDTSFLKKHVYLVVADLGKVPTNTNIWFMLAASWYYVATKMSTFAGVVGDMICIVTSFGLACKVQAVSQELARIFSVPEVRVRKIHMSVVGLKNNVALPMAQSWGKIHCTLADLRKQATEISWFLSPIFAISIVETTMNVIINLNQSLNATDMFYRNKPGFLFVSLVHYVFRLLIIVYFVSNAFRNSDQLLDLIEEADVPDFNKGPPFSDRIQTMLHRKPIGITFFDMFYISQTLFLSILSFIFTVQIVILQVSPNAKS